MWGVIAALKEGKKYCAGDPPCGGPPLSTLLHTTAPPDTHATLSTRSPPPPCQQLQRARGRRAQRRVLPNEAPPLLLARPGRALPSERLLHLGRLFYCDGSGPLSTAGLRRQRPSSGELREEQGEGCLAAAVVGLARHFWGLGGWRGCDTRIAPRHVCTSWHCEGHGARATSSQGAHCAQAQADVPAICK